MSRRGRPAPSPAADLSAAGPMGRAPAAALPPSHRATETMADEIVSGQSVQKSRHGDAQWKGAVAAFLDASHTIASKELEETLAENSKDEVLQMSKAPVYETESGEGESTGQAAWRWVRVLLMLLPWDNAATRHFWGTVVPGVGWAAAWTLLVDADESLRVEGFDRVLAYCTAFATLLLYEDMKKAVAIFFNARTMFRHMSASLLVAAQALAVATRVPRAQSFALSNCRFILMAFPYVMKHIYASETGSGFKAGMLYLPSATKHALMQLVDGKAADVEPELLGETNDASGDSVALKVRALTRETYLRCRVPIDAPRAPLQPEHALAVLLWASISVATDGFRGGEAPGSVVPGSVQGDAEVLATTLDGVRRAMETVLERFGRLRSRRSRKFPVIYDYIKFLSYAAWMAALPVLLEQHLGVYTIPTVAFIVWVTALLAVTRDLMRAPYAKPALNPWTGFGVSKRARATARSIDLILGGRLEADVLEAQRDGFDINESDSAQQIMAHLHQSPDDATAEQRLQELFDRQFHSHAERADMRMPKSMGTAAGMRRRHRRDKLQ